MAIFLLFKLCEFMTTITFLIILSSLLDLSQVCLLIDHTQLIFKEGVASIPVALLSERYAMRRWPFIFGIVIVISSQILLMEAKNYPIMCVAQLAQGIGSSLVWVVSLAIL